MAVNTLVVDDDTITLFLIKKLIQATEFGSKVQYFHNSSKALDHFRSIYNTTDRFIIFLDINMPDINGWDFLQKIEAFANTENTHILIISSSTDQADMDRAMASQYVRKFLVKPILAENLVELKASMNV